MSNTKYQWDDILKQCADIVSKELESGNKVPNRKKLHEKLGQTYQGVCPPYHTFRQELQGHLLQNKASKNDERSYESLMCELAERYDKMTLPMLAQAMKVSSASVTQQNFWIFLRLKHIESKYQDLYKRIVCLANELKKEFKQEILFISFDRDTITILCRSDADRKALMDYLEKQRGIECEEL